MMQEIFLSLCIPTNGISEWVLPVLNSIITQKVDSDLYEVVIADNGNNINFSQDISNISKENKNIRYYKSQDIGFTNQIFCIKKARGRLVKFVNHRMPLEEGAIEYLISIAEKYYDSQPVVYFSNGKLKLTPTPFCCDSFDKFVYSLSYYSSWSAGLALWREQIAKLNILEVNKTFPHTDILFGISDANQYLIFDKIIMKELSFDPTKKGKYNVFKAFAVEYIRILLSLLLEDKISYCTYNHVMKENKKLLAFLYLEHVIRKKPSSYILDDRKEFCNIFYNYRSIVFYAFLKWIKDMVLCKNK